MAFIRRGYVPRHYEGPPSILLTCLGGTAVVIDVARIHCFEEHSLPKCLQNWTTVFCLGVNYTVVEKFDEIAERLAGKAVAP